MGKPKKSKKGSVPMPTVSVLKRTVTVELIQTKEQEEELKELGNLCSKLWNQVNYERRRQFFNGEHSVDIKGTYNKWYNEYKEKVGTITAQQVLNKNNEAWSSFFSLLRAKKEEKLLLPFIKKINPPGYWKDKKKRKLIIVLRKDQYKIDKEKQEIELRHLGKFEDLKIRYKGEIYYRGEQGRLEIIYNSMLRKWYAHITIKANERLDRKTGKWMKVPLTPKGNLVGGIDIGINNLLAVYISDGTQVLIKTRVLKSISYYFMKLISMKQKLLSLYKQPFSNEIRRLYVKWKRELNTIIDATVRKVVEFLYNKGVSLIKVGYPKNISQKKGNFLVANVWSYKQVMDKLRDVAEEHGITVEFVNEAYTSTTCPIHGNGCGKRVSRGLFKCTTSNKVFNADLVGAFNISIILSPNDGGVEGTTTRGIGISWGKTTPLVYTWTRGSGLVVPASYDSMRLKRIDQNL
ncbi:transposase [Candidatus Acidianus copahuensis]|uniref:Transposase n=1 Tax=Candidatus Acidianus copahuensis TaxID=1160895 RepID=A0A031LNX2_9CREN|nr:RNA-guided endonuclease TnpB family protein [Candidatus Acidianus copahuensis]EZQ06706.1 transposase [Candidatus Acidianus copahuensis]